MSSEQYSTKRTGRPTYREQINKLEKENEQYKKQQKESWAYGSRLKGQIDELLEENKKLKEEIRHLEDRAVADYDSHMNQYKEYKEYYDKWSPILSDIDGDEFCDLLSDYGWKYNDEGELVNVDDDQTIQDINGKDYQMPTQEQADHFGISLEEMIELMKTTDCDFSD